MTCEIDSVQASVEQANQSVIAQSLRDPIQITTNEQFDTLGFPGSGTSEDPYRIENLHFILNDTFWTQIAIAISGTNKSFEISDCIFEGFIEDFGDWTDVGGTGVKLILAKNGVISNCEFKTLREGVSLEGSEDIVIEECSFTSTYSMEAEHGPPEGTVTEYAGSSIKIDSFDDGSTDVMVKDCDMTHFGAGVETSGGSSNISIIRNSIVECNVGIHPQRSQFVEISNNTCLYNV
ncbi:MAG: right-handed parallel beta-helix repeat-containing protein, partial [Candidatus Thorarchaeota archaeon]